MPMAKGGFRTMVLGALLALVITMFGLVPVADAAVCGPELPHDVATADGLSSKSTMRIRTTTRVRMGVRLAPTAIATMRPTP
ncbi:hypothetical protein U0030_02465 [Brevundimonas bullata]|uniref:hypothetical protein n=1 Tax=Brevundimonas bullata TaxID=13160 RepID=UPI000E0AAC3B|nr:hypothetical protein [Brevundimonas bullata]WQE37360.1 hypothetical protein U0030_02465 [Brevundimonas bullata]